MCDAVEVMSVLGRPIEAAWLWETLNNTIEKATIYVPKQQNKGEWEERRVIQDARIQELQYERCSVCGKYHTTPYLYNITDYAYCPHCGAAMEEGGADG